MRVTRDLKNILRRKLEDRNKEIMSKYKKQLEKTHEKDMKRLKEIEIQRNKLEDEKNNIYNAVEKLYRIGDRYDRNYINIYSDHIEIRGSPKGMKTLDIDEELMVMVEEIELTNDKEGILAKLFEKIKNME